MSAIIETGHAKNVANFEDLISFCVGYGATYNPVNANKKVAALQTKQTAALAAIQTVKTTKTAYDNSTNAREIVFASIKKLSTRIVNALEATTATNQTIDDAKTVNRKIQGKRATSTSKVAAANAAAVVVPNVAPPVNTISVSQQSFDSLIDHFAKLIQVVSTEPAYLPNETELKAATLTTLLASLKTANTSVINANTAYSNARIARNTALYAPDTGLVDIAAEVKKYVKSIFGSTSPQFKQVSKLNFSSVKS